MRVFLRFLKVLLLLPLLLGAVGCASVHSANGKPQNYWGPFYSNYEDIQGRDRCRAAGPLFESIDHEGREKFLAFRPFYATGGTEEKNRKASYYLWPVASSFSSDDTSAMRFLLLTHHVGNRDTTGLPNKWMVFPIYFQGTTRDGEKYLGVFPIYGSAKDLLFFQEVEFCCFPLWSRWHKNGSVTTNYLWPFFSFTEGETLNRTGVFPFYGSAVKDDRYSHRYILWPIWTSTETTYAGSAGNAWVLWPFYGRVDMTDQKGWMVLPPFIRYNKGTDGATLLNAPWPFVQCRAGDGKDKLYLWPLWGTRSVGDQSTNFFLWPLFWSGQRSFGRDQTSFFRFIPFVNHHHTVRPAADGSLETSRIYTKVWPICDERKINGVQRLNILSLWPFKSSGGVEASWSPLWTLLSHVRVDDVGYETDFLWGTYHRRHEPGKRSDTSIFPLVEWHAERDDGARCEWSVLKGFFGYKTRNGIRRYRLLYLLNFGGSKEELEQF